MFSSLVTEERGVRSSSAVESPFGTRNVEDDFLPVKSNSQRTRMASSSQISAPLATEPQFVDDDAIWVDWLFFLGSVGILGLAWLLESNGQGKFFVPGTDVVLPEMCMARRLFGWTCPGCGLTRSVVAMVQGHWLDAVVKNPAGPLFVVMFIAQVPYRIGRLWRRRHGPTVEYSGGTSTTSSEIPIPTSNVWRIVGPVARFLVSGRYAVLTMVVMFAQWMLRPLVLVFV